MNNSPICTTEYYCQFSYVYFYRNTTVKFIQQESFHFLDGRRLRQLLQNHNKRKIGPSNRIKKTEERRTFKSTTIKSRSFQNLKAYVIWNKLFTNNRIQKTVGWNHINNREQRID